MVDSTSEGAGECPQSGPGSVAARRKALALFAVLFGFGALAAAAFLWMALNGLEQSGAGDYSGTEAFLEDRDAVEGVRLR